MIKITGPELEKIFGEKEGQSLTKMCRSNLNDVSNVRHPYKEGFIFISAWDLNDIIAMVEKEISNPPSKKRFKSHWREKADEVLEKLIQIESISI